MTDFDFVVVGAGHNALTTAAYLAQAGYRVGIFERRNVIGGAVVTEEHVPGFRFDLGGSAHIMISHTPVVSDLGLERYGLEYINVDPLFFAPFPDGSHITVWKDVDKTCESIAAVSPEDALAYRRFIDDWSMFAQKVVDAFLLPPTPKNLVDTLGTDSVDDPLRQLGPILGTYGQLVRRSFKSEKVRAVVAWMAAQSGPPPSEALSAAYALLHPLYHLGGVRRPRGGSGMLTQALGRMIEDHGGQIFTGHPVTRILTQGGRAIGVETADGQQATARHAVVSGAHIHTTLQLLGQTPPRSMDIGNGFGMIVRYAMNDLPNYNALPSSDDGQPGPQHRAIQFICPSLEYLDRSYQVFKQGRPSRDPALLSMTFSAVDPTLAPPGKHTLFLWGQYYPYDLASGEHWDEIAQREANRMLDTLAQYAPNVKDAVIDQLIETPLYLERTLGLLRGNVMHLEMRVKQMFTLRPGLKLSHYRGPVDCLYLTGASTHPGGGIMGASGHNTAKVILADLDGVKA
ncbi:MAG: NAD(P)/FAD-dependent oxidoreductase [Chloroflexi bacterium]|nr:NAD(P)/FAD-dependent oxidoreductase [Chloroflexota bacterium]